MENADDPPINLSWRSARGDMKSKVLHFGTYNKNLLLSTGNSSAGNNRGEWGRSDVESEHRKTRHQCGVGWKKQMCSWDSGRDIS